MKKDLVLPMLAVLGSTMVPLTFFIATAYAQDIPYTEDYMAQHDGGDRAEYLQEMEYSDPWFYVPPVNDANYPTTSKNTSDN